MNQSANNIKIRTMRVTLAFSFVLMALKFFAYYLTNSNAVLTDALESIINVAAGAFALFSIYFASLPKDEDHPYGHGKIEFVSAGFEGALIFIAGISIIIKSIYGFYHQNEIGSLDTGAIFIAAAGFCNFIMGRMLIRQGKKYNSVLMIADGKHLIVDTISSIILVAGLIIIHFTNMYWLDNAMAILLGLVILRTGYQLIKESVNSLLDEADKGKLKTLVEILNRDRKDDWIDVHNLRVQKFGSHLHIDCHLTLPWYHSLVESHHEVSAMEKLVRDKLDGEVEFFIHSDPCVPPTSCEVCPLKDCKERKANFVKRLDWTMENMLPDRKHKLS